MPAKITLTCGRAGPPAKSEVPQSPQNRTSISLPLSATRRRTFGSPSSTASPSTGTWIDVPNAAPVRFWHSVQWQA